MLPPFLLSREAIALGNDDATTLAIAALVLAYDGHWICRPRLAGTGRSVGPTPFSGNDAYSVSIFTSLVILRHVSISPAMN